MKLLALLLFSMLYFLTACTMLTAWRTIPAPEGCGECHKTQISSNWQVAYKPATINDETGRLSFQTPESIAGRSERPSSMEGKQKLEQLECFECHNAPDPTHRQRKGKFHH